VDRTARVTLGTVTLLEAAVRRITIVIGFVVACLLALPLGAAARKSAGRHFGARATALVFAEDWPLAAAVRAAIVHPARTDIKVVGATFLEPVPFAETRVVATAAPSRDAIVWEDGETLLKDEDWTQFTLGCDSRGGRMWLEIQTGKVQFEWAEVVFQTGESQVVEFSEKVQTPGLFSLLDVPNGKIVDHVRVLARAKSDEAKVIVRLQRG
jgi:hypothetical protein